MRQFASVREDHTLIRDTATGMLLANDRSAYERRKALKIEKKRNEQLVQTLHSIVDRLTFLEEEVRTLKAALGQKNGC